MVGGWNQELLAIKDGVAGNVHSLDLVNMESVDARLLNWDSLLQLTHHELYHITGAESIIN